MRQWLTSVIPATWVTEIRTVVQGHTGQKVSETPFQQTNLTYWLTPAILATQKAIGMRISIQNGLVRTRDPIQK
jgi:hypothetical protein